MKTNRKLTSTERVKVIMEWMRKMRDEKIIYAIEKILARDGIDKYQYIEQHTLTLEDSLNMFSEISEKINQAKYNDLVYPKKHNGEARVAKFDIIKIDESWRNLLMKIFQIKEEKVVTKENKKTNKKEKKEKKLRESKTIAVKQSSSVVDVLNNKKNLPVVRSFYFK